jgi:hypothetical protein
MIDLADRHDTYAKMHRDGIVKLHIEGFNTNTLETVTEIIACHTINDVLNALDY